MFIDPETVTDYYQEEFIEQIDNTEYDDYGDIECVFEYDYE